MERSLEEYETNLEKELKRRKVRMYRDIGVLLLSAIFAVYLFMFGEGSNVNILLILVLIGYSMITIYGLKKKLRLYHSYFDELRVEKRSIVKYNPKRDKVISSITFDSITKVYTNIKKMPYTLYVLYETEGEKKAEGFYKTRIKDEDEFRRVLKKKDLLNEEDVSVDDLMDIIQCVNE